MGYDTHFQGRLTLSKELTAPQLKTLTEFLEKDHKEPGIWTRWCDWRTDGKKLFWNGAEKSYDMELWLQVILDRFMKFWGIEVTGKMLAQGNNRTDTWTLEVKDGKVIKTRISIPDDFGVTD